ncbi:MAG TPA: hypothetical protein DEP60_06655 [Ruminococcaceae bacterium]|nr:hypothetical protein [Oscillospiraceae bacterium]
MHGTDCLPRAASGQTPSFVKTTTVAFGALRAIQQQGLNIPRDIGLICFDNYPLSEIMDPMPTVVDINVHDMGIQAATLLLRKIRHPELQVQAFTTMPVLKVRTTTASSGNGSLEKELMPAGKR